MTKPTPTCLMRKPLESVRRDAEQTGADRSLGPAQQVLIGLGCIVGAGVYVMTCAVATHQAGTAVVVSFIIAAICVGYGHGLARIRDAARASPES